MSEPLRDEDLTAWIARLFEDPAMLAMGHNQRSRDLNLGLGWLYYGLARIVYPRRAVVIGSYRGFVPLVVGKALSDNDSDNDHDDTGEVVFLDPSMVDDFWKDADATRAHFERFGLRNIRHFEMTTQQFVESDDYRRLSEIGLLFIDGYHSEAQARYDYGAFENRLAPGGIALFHDSMILRQSEIYGADRAYEIRVKSFIDEIKRDSSVQVFDVPYGTGLTLVRKPGGGSPEPLLIGNQARPPRP